MASPGLAASAPAAVTGRPWLRRSIVLALTLVTLVAACSGAGTGAPGGGGGGGGGGTGANGGGGVPFSGDACKLLSTDEVKQVVQHDVTHVEPQQKGCSWHFTGSFGIDYYVSLDITSPGGRDDFQATRNVSQMFGGAFQSLGAAAATMAAPIDSNLAGNVGGLFQVQDLQGIGDAAFQGAGQVVYALKGDTEIALQIVDVEDSGIVDKAIALAKLVIGRV